MNLGVRKTEPNSSCSPFTNRLAFIKSKKNMKTLNLDLLNEKQQQPIKSKLLLEV